MFNKIIDIYEQSLLSVDLFEQLITPNNTNDIVPIAKEMMELFGAPIGTKKIVPELTNSSITLASSNNRKFYEFLSGKRALGIFALNNVLSQLLQQSGMKINSYYGEFDNTVTAEKGVFMNLDKELQEKEIENMRINKKFLYDSGLESDDILKFETTIKKPIDQFYKEQLKENPAFNEKDLLIKMLESIC